jgi:hypothetical protein
MMLDRDARHYSYLDAICSSRILNDSNILSSKRESASV